MSALQSRVVQACQKSDCLLVCSNSSTLGFCDSRSLPINASSLYQVSREGSRFRILSVCYSDFILILGSNRTLSRFGMIFGGEFCVVPMPDFYYVREQILGYNLIESLHSWLLVLELFSRKSEPAIKCHCL